MKIINDANKPVINGEKRSQWHQWGEANVGNNTDSMLEKATKGRRVKFAFDI